MRYYKYVVGGAMCLVMLVFTLRALPDLDSRHPRHFKSSRRFATHLKPPSDVCDGKKVYVYDLPPVFNVRLRERCEGGLADWIDFCPHLVNDGIGRKIEDWPHWHLTDVYMLEVIFHERMLSYTCRTDSPADAEAFFIPYYGGLESLEYLYGSKNTSRNTQGTELTEWLRKIASDSWNRYGGHDHFMVLGRTSWDFTRSNDTSWGTRLLQQPDLKNITTLVLERMPWAYTQQAVPYPSSFHPPSQSGLDDWMRKVKDARRTSLYTFVGAPRPNKPEDIRTLLIEQCNASSSCSFLDCRKIPCSHNPVPIAQAFLKADFCLQPRGDTATRRSVFDSMIAGCIPVFFHADSAYTQYKWHLPEDPALYSVYIDEQEIRDGLNVEDILNTFSPEEIEGLRETVVSLIPSLVYKNFSSSQDFGRMRDAFDISIEELLKRVKAWKQEQRFCLVCFVGKLFLVVSCVCLVVRFFKRRPRLLSN